MASNTNRRVLADLERMVGAMADATHRETGMLQGVADGWGTYLRTAESLLTDAGSPSGVAAGMEMLDGLGANLVETAGAVAAQQDARADGLEQVRKKEAEEKEDGGGRNGGGQDGGAQDGGREDDGGEDGEGSGSGRTRTRPGEEPPIPEADPPGTTAPPGDGNGASGGSPGTTTGPGETGPGTAAPPPGGEGDPSRAPPPREPEPADPPPTAEGEVEIVDKRTRRCFSFRLGNASRKPVSDLHFDGKDMRMTSSEVGRPGGGMENWEPLNVPGGNGFWFRVKEGQPPLPPGRATGRFRFCTESSPRGFEIRMTHPDLSTTPIGPGGITHNGRPARMRNGQTLLPPDSVETVYDLEVTATSGGRELQIGASNGTLSQDVSGPDPNAYDAYRDPNDRRQVNIRPVDGRQSFRPNETVRVTVSSSSPNVRFRVR